MFRTSLHARGLIALQSIGMALLLLSLISCNGPASSSAPMPGSGPGGRNPAGIHVAFISATTSLNFAQEMAAGAQYAAEQYHVPAQIVAPAAINDPVELDLFQKLRQTARDGIAVETLNPNLFTQAEASTVKQGIPLIAVDTVPPLASLIRSYVGNDSMTTGKMLADAAIALIPPPARGKILIGIDNFGIPVLRERALGIEQEFHHLRPAIQVTGPFDSHQPRPLNLDSWTQAITSQADLIACLGVGDADSASLAQIKQDRHGTYLSGAFDLDPTALQAIANGTTFAQLDPEHFLKGYVAMRLLIEHALYGKHIPQGWWSTPALLVTQRNIRQVMRRQLNLASRGRFFQPTIDQAFANPLAQVKPLSQAR